MYIYIYTSISPLPNPIPPGPRERSQAPRQRRWPIPDHCRRRLGAWNLPLRGLGAGAPPGRRRPGPKVLEVVPHPRFSFFWYMSLVTP